MLKRIEGWKGRHIRELMRKGKKVGKLVRIGGPIMPSNIDTKSAFRVYMDAKHEGFSGNNLKKIGKFKAGSLPGKIKPSSSTGKLKVDKLKGKYTLKSVRRPKRGER